MFAPINKIPPEILALIPDFWDTCKRDQDTITPTHVCRTWREVFISRPSLWTHFDCLDEEKTRTYLERSKSSPINLNLILAASEGVLPCHPFFQIIPHATWRLESLLLKGTPENILPLTSRLSHPAPLLRHLSIFASRKSMPGSYLTLTPTLFNGDLSSLRTLHLESVRTELSWRNMINLTSFTLYHTPPRTVSVGQFLDFFENSPYLEEVELHSTTPTTGVRGGRLVLLARLGSMEIHSYDPTSILLDHLLIPAGAKLEIGANPVNSSIREYLPRSLDNLKNFSNFTVTKLHLDTYCPRMEFSGPNGQVEMSLGTSRDNPTGSVFEYLAEFDSKTEQLEINGGYFLVGDPLYQALLPMKDLRTLTLSVCRHPDIFISALQPATGSSEVMVCPKPEELVLVLHPHETMIHITNMAAARASRGEKLRTVRIVDGWSAANFDVSELRKHVWNVEYCPAFLL